MPILTVVSLQNNVKKSFRYNLSFCILLSFRYKCPVVHIMKSIRFTEVCFGPYRLSLRDSKKLKISVLYYLQDVHIRVLRHRLRHRH